MTRTTTQETPEPTPAPTQPPAPAKPPGGPYEMGEGSTPDAHQHTNTQPLDHLRDR